MLIQTRQSLAAREITSQSDWLRRREFLGRSAQVATGVCAGSWLSGCFEPGDVQGDGSSSAPRGEKLRLLARLWDRYPR